MTKKHFEERAPFKKKMGPVAEQVQRIWDADPALITSVAQLKMRTGLDETQPAFMPLAYLLTAYLAGSRKLIKDASSLAKFAIAEAGKENGMSEDDIKQFQETALNEIHQIASGFDKQRAKFYHAHERAATIYRS